MAILGIAVAALLALGAFVLVRRTRVTVEATRAEAERAITAAKTQFEHDLAATREQLGRQRELLTRLQRSWRAEREWSRELRSQLARQDQAPVGLDARDGDVPDLVLRAAIELTESECGLLLSQEDEDHDGDLDVVASHGFRQDPTHSALAQRFARVVLERDEIVREDEPAPDSAPAAADDEIRSLVAIPLYLRDRFHGVVVCANRSEGYQEVDDEVLLALGDQAGAALHHGGLRRELQEARRSTVRALVEAVAMADPVMQRESNRLVVHALHLARELELEARERDVLVCAVLLRALGNLGLPDHVLGKPEPLTDEERLLVEVHPRTAFTVIAQAPFLRDVGAAVLYHHERYDGSGYPAGLAGEQIPRAARALSVLEAFGAMTAERPYREALSIEEALHALVAGSATQFDPEIVALFVEEVRRSPRPPADELGESLLEALPLDPARGALTGPLGASTTDGLTLLGDRRALQQSIDYAIADHARERGLGLALVQLRDLDQVNAESSFLAGDRMLQAAARNAQRAAARTGGTAYRVSGRRLAVVAPLGSSGGGDGLTSELEAEFVGGPPADVVAVDWQPGESGAQFIARARRLL
jgi:HD-GYP domain-containing protein (c-di-GMP phosphodiesterase class II)